MNEANYHAVDDANPIRGGRVTIFLVDIIHENNHFAYKNIAECNGKLP